MSLITTGSNPKALKPSKPRKLKRGKKLTAAKPKQIKGTGKGRKPDTMLEQLLKGTL